MKSVVFKGVGLPLAVEDIAVPQPGPKQIQIKVQACGICGSDLNYVKHPRVPDRVVMGHEFSGEVASVGEGVTEWQVGDRVVAMATTTCGVCEDCRRGDEFNCRYAQSFGFNPELNGAYSEYVVVGARDTVKLPANVPYEVGATVEPLAVAYDAVRQADFGEAESVLIVGAGPIGLCIALWAKYFGAMHVVVADRVESRLKVAREMGATATINVSQQDTRQTFESLTGGRPSVTFEAVGMPGLIQQCVSVAAPGSKIVVVGVCKEPDTINPKTCIHKRLKMTFAYGYSLQDFRNIVTLLSQERIDVTPMIRHRVTLDEVPKTFAEMATPGGQVKVIIEPAA